MKKLVGLLIVMLSVSPFVANAQTISFYVDSPGSTTIPRCFNGTCATAAPESWAVNVLVDVQYDGTTTVNLLGQNALTSGSGRVPRPGHAITTISSTGLVTAIPVLLSSVAGSAPFTVYVDSLGNAWTDSAYTIPLTYDIYGNPIDPSTATFNADGSVATAGTAYVDCPSCANLPTYQDYQRNPDPNIYLGPPITGWLHVCKDLTTTNADGSSVEQYQACTSAWATVGPHDSPSYAAGAPVLDGSGNPVTLSCVKLKGSGGAYPYCTWSGSLPIGLYLLTGAGTSASSSGASTPGGSTLMYPVSVPAPPAPPPPVCPPDGCGDD